jgi:hypothetical protein
MGPGSPPKLAVERSIRSTPANFLKNKDNIICLI